MLLETSELPLGSGVKVGVAEKELAAPVKVGEMAVPVAASTPVAEAVLLSASCWEGVRGEEGEGRGEGLAAPRGDDVPPTRSTASEAEACTVAVTLAVVAREAEGLALLQLLSVAAGLGEGVEG